MEENIGEKKTNKIGLIVLIVVLVLGVGCGAFFLEKQFGDKKPTEPLKKEEPAPQPEPTKPAETPEELNDVTFIDVKVEKLDSSKIYEVQLAKKENKNSMDDEDKYVYNHDLFRNNNKLVIEYTTRDGDESDESGDIQKAYFDLK